MKDMSDVSLCCIPSIEEEDMRIFKVQHGSRGFFKGFQNRLNAAGFLDRGMTKEDIVIHKLLVGH